MIEYHTAIQPHLAPMFHLHHHSADLQLNTLKRSTELGEASHRSISSGRAGKRMQRSIPRDMRIQSSRRKTKQFSSYFRFPTSHTTVRAVPHTAVPILDTIRDTPPLK